MRDGRIAAIGKAGNPWMQDGVTPGMIVGASTEVIAGEGMILTAGAIDAHVHFICPQQVETALAKRRDDDARRRHRPRVGHERDDVHAGSVASRAHARRDRRAARERRVSRQGQRVGRPARCANRCARAPRASSCTRTGGRRRPRSTPRSRLRTSWTCRSRSTPIRSTRWASSRTRCVPSPGARSTRIIPKAPAAGTRRTSSASRASRTCCRRRRTRRGPSPSTRSPSTSTC